MGAKSGVGLKFLQWLLRGIQFCCCALVLAIFSYFLATMHNHNIDIPTDVRAVEGISGFGVLYTIGGLLLLCCLAGIPFLSFVAIVLDVAFAAAFIYVAVVNRGGAGSCNDYVDTPFGRGQSTGTPTGSDGFTNLPSFRQACQMQSACLAVSIVAIFFFIFSVFVEVSLVRHRRKESRFGPSPANNYTSGYGHKGGFFSRFRRQNTVKSENHNALPEHTTPDQIRQSYNTESTAVGRDSTNYPKYGDSDYHHASGNRYDGQTAYPDTGVDGEYRTPHTHNSNNNNNRYGDGTYNV